MSKYVFPVLLAAAAATAAAQSEGPPAPVYDPQGRLIPYDVKPEPQVETPPRASSAKPGAKAGKKKAGKKKSGKRKAAAKPAKAKKAKTRKARAAAKKKPKASSAKSR